MEKKIKPQGTSSCNNPKWPRWRFGSNFSNRVHTLCGYPHYHKYIMPAWLGKDGVEFNIMLTDENDKPIVFLNKDGKGNFTVLAEKGSIAFELMTVYCDSEKVYKEYPKYKEY